MVKILTHKQKEKLKEKYSLAYIQAHVQAPTTTKNLMETSHKFADELLEARDEMPKIAINRYYDTDKKPEKRSIFKTIFIGILLVLILLGARQVVLFILDSMQ